MDSTILSRTCWGRANTALRSSRNCGELRLFVGGRLAVPSFADCMHSARVGQALPLRRSCRSTSRVTCNPPGLGEAFPLPIQAERELNLPRILRRTDPSEIRCSVDQSRPIEIGVIGQIEEVGSEHHIQRLVDFESSLQAGIPCGQARPANNISPLISRNAESPLRVGVDGGRCKRIDVEPPVRTTLARFETGI